MMMMIFTIPSIPRLQFLPQQLFRQHVPRCVPQRGLQGLARLITGRQLQIGGRETHVCIRVGNVDTNGVLGGRDRGVGIL